jgi:ArgK protein.
VNAPPRGTIEPSGYVTSLTKAAESHRLAGTGESGGTDVNVFTAIGLDVVESERVGVGESCVAIAACVDILSRVCAAAVYSALSVAAGCGVEAAKGLHARIVTRARLGIRNFLKRVLGMKGLQSINKPLC